MNCPICSDNNASEREYADIPNTFEIDCRRCGTYIAQDSFMHSAPNNLSADQIGRISGWVYEHQSAVLNSSSWEQILSQPILSVGEKADKLLIHLARKYPKPNQAIAFSSSGSDLAACYASDSEEGNYIFHRYLREHKKFISTPVHGGDPVVIAPLGWDHLHTIGQVNKESKIGFCAMWFDHDMTSIWSDAIELAIKDAGYKPIRIDKYHHNNRIDDEIIVMLRKSRFVIADFTGNRGGVYFEAGYALGLGIPVIWTVEKDQLSEVHFDNRQYSFILWEKDKLDVFRTDLMNRIKATIGEGSPI